MKPQAMDGADQRPGTLLGGRFRLPAIAGSATGSLATAFAAQALLVISGVLAIRLLGPDNRGHLALFALLPAVITQLGLLGVQDAVTYWIARDRHSAAGIVRSMAWPIAAQVLLCTVVHAVALWLLVHDETRSVQLAGFVTLAVTPSYLAFNYGLAILKGLQHFAAINTLRLVPLVLYGAVLAPIFLIEKDRLPTVAVGWVGAYCVTAVTTVAMTLRRMPRGHDTGTIPPRADLFRFGAKGFVGSASPLETFRLDQAVVGLFLSPAALGLYVASLAFTNLPRFVAGSVGTVAFPYIASQPDERLARRSMWRFFWATVVCSLLIAALLIAAARDLVPLLFGVEFRDAVVPAQILLVGSVVGGARRILGDGLRGLGNPAANTIAEVASWIWLVPALALLTPRWELEGVAVALVSASLFSLGILAVTIVASREPAPRLTGSRFRFGVRLRDGTETMAKTFHTGRRSSHRLLLSAAVGAVAGTSVLITRLSLAAAAALVAVTAAVLLAAFVMRRYGTRGLSSFALAAATATLAMNGVRLTTTVALSDLFLFVAGLILLPGLLVHAKQRLAPVKWLTGGTLLIVLGGLAGTAIANDPALSLSQLMRFSIASVLLPILFALWNPSVAEIRRVAWLWVASVTVSSAVAVGEVGTFYHDGRADGLTTHPNHLALTCAMAIGPAVVLTLLARGLMRWVGLGVCAVLGAGLLISGSRAGLIAFVMALIAMAVLTRRAAIAGGIVGAAIVATGLIFSGLVDLPAGNAFARLFGSDDRTVTTGILGSDAARQEELRRGLERIMEHPLTGTGFELALAAHDIYLQVWASAGILGLVGFGIIIIALLNLPVRAFLARSSFVEPSSMLLVGFGASFFGYLVAGLFQNALWDRYIWLTLALVAVTTPHAAQSLAGARIRRGRPPVAVPRVARGGVHAA